MEVNIAAAIKGVVGFHCENVVVGIQVIGARKAEVRVTVYAVRKAVLKPRQPVVGSVILAKVKVADREAAGSVQTKRDGGRNTKAADLVVGTTSNSAFVGHNVYAERRTMGQIR